MESRNLFFNAFILGGSPCSGKSTAAERLAKEYDRRYYKVDDHEREHAERCNPEEHPVITHIFEMSWDENFLRPVEVQVEEAFAFYRERFGMIREDLEAYDDGRPFILEGAAYLPELLSQYGASRDRVLFMVPTFEFQVTHYRKRPWIKFILNACNDPELAFNNWMMRDHLFGQEILQQAKANGYETLIVDGHQGIDGQYQKVVDIFRL